LKKYGKEKSNSSLPYVQKGKQMKFFVSTLLIFSINSLAMEKEYSIQDLIDSKPNYRLCMGSECCLASLPSSKSKFTSIIGIENVEDVKRMYRINLDNNLIRLQGSPFQQNEFTCRVFTLNSNGISTFNPAFFAGLKHLLEIELKNNKIEELKTEDLKNFPAHIKLVLIGNPISQDNKEEILTKFPELDILF
jgi:Leucine-rich repeat (LRR) protein